ncbi:MAG: ABC transporter ATP-binding protein [Clostridia bacterium]|nr:ABC transporter ATP-binding protein [Clostridia bacterium]
MKGLLPYFKQYKKQSVLGPLFKLLEATFELLVPVIVGLIIDKGLGEGVMQGAKRVYPNADKGFIFAMCGVLVLFGLVGFVCAVTAQYFAAKAATGVSSKIRKALFKKLQSLSYADFDALGSSAMLTRMTGDINQFQSGVNLFLRLFLRSPFIVFGAMAAAFFISVKAGLVFLATIPLLSIVVFTVMFVTKPLHKKSREKLDGVLLTTRENLNGARVIRAFCKENEEQETFVRKNAELTKSRKIADGISALTNPLTYVLVNLGIVALVYVGALQVNVGSLSQGSVVALYNLMTQILIELIKLANLIVSVTKAAACGNRIEEVLQMQPSLQTVSERTGEDEKHENEKDYIRFEKVSLRYHKGAEPALEEIDFSVKKGETIGVIGGTGSGKTTLVNLLPHFYDATGGTVYLDGKNVANYDLKELRQKIAVVPQKATLFKGTVKDNLLWGNPNATDEELYSALKIAQADALVQDKGGLSAQVEQDGKNFSGGQKQRLCVARALVKRADILILDDSSSALDFATESAMRKEISKLKYNAVFIVSQRASSLRHADKIVVLDDGKAVGVGTHEELVKTCEVYREIYRLQYPDENGKGGVK